MLLSLLSTGTYIFGEGSNVYPVGFEIKTLRQGKLGHDILAVNLACC